MSRISDFEILHMESGKKRSEIFTLLGKELKRMEPTTEEKEAMTFFKEAKLILSSLPLEMERIIKYEKCWDRVYPYWRITLLINGNREMVVTLSENNSKSQLS